MHVTRALPLLVLLASAASALLSAAGCEGCVSQDALPVRKVLVDVDPPAASAGVDREVVRGVVNEMLGKARGFRLVEAERGEAALLRVRVEAYRSEAPSATEARARGTVTLTVEVTDVPGESGVGYRGHSVASASGQVEPRVLVAQALRDALAQVQMTRTAGDLDSAQLIAWLDDPAASAEQRRRAVRILGSRRERAATEALARALLDREDVELAQLALVAVTNIGDPAALDAVIEFSERQPGPVRKQCIEAVRAMGTPRGKAWLFVLASGHPDDEVQAQAAAALSALEQREPKGPAVADNAAGAPGGDRNVAAQ
ncbi:MAG: hypothetical protein A2138_02440 [Deltaproteobacteria bacterium RBG_16_71_12]|nr:MAG: hypothetical protein A2138_02440 [Deltaproteobacteria bacterium RBG_16_71_12]